MNFESEHDKPQPPFALGLTLGFMIGAGISMFATARVVDQQWKDRISADITENEAGGEVTHEGLNNFGSMRMKSTSN
jgi:hypothetical protein